MYYPFAILDAGASSAKRCTADLVNVEPNSCWGVDVPIQEERVALGPQVRPQLGGHHASRILQPFKVCLAVSSPSQGYILASYWGELGASHLSIPSRYCSLEGISFDEGENATTIHDLGVPGRGAQSAAAKLSAFCTRCSHVFAEENERLSAFKLVSCE